MRIERYLQLFGYEPSQDQLQLDGFSGNDLLARDIAGLGKKGQQRCLYGSGLTGRVCVCLSARGVI